MGFQFAPGTFTLGAMTKINTYISRQNNHMDNVQYGDSDLNGWGPKVLYDQIGGGLKKLKVAIVLTTLRAYATYPGDTQKFGYSGIYTEVNVKNLYIPLKKATVAGEYNTERYELAKLTYGIYGLASFKISPVAGCSHIDIDVTISDINSAIVRTDNTDALTDLFIAGDFYSKPNAQVCANVITSFKKMLDIPSKTYSTVPDLQINQQNVQQTANDPPSFRLDAYPLQNGSSTVTFNVTVKYTGFVVGNAYAIKLALQKNLASAVTWDVAMTENTIKYVKWTTSLDGKVLHDANLTSATTPSTLGDSTKDVGIVIKTANPVLTFIVTIPRPADASNAHAPPLTTRRFVADLTVEIREYSQVYNPVTDCCISQCPDGSGVNLKSTPPSCIVCKGDPNLSFDSNTGVCSCKTGYYNTLSDSNGNLACFPCMAKLCSTCSSDNITVCTGCVTGAAFNSNNVCECVSGFFETNGTCQTCPAKCNGCQVNGVCNACQDSANRKLDQNCDCPAGLYDDGSATCKTCNPICKTCTNSSACTSCFAENNRALVNGQCVCASGYYQVVQADNTVVCRKCNPECKECTGPTLCLNCDPALNRINGLDEAGHQTCFCAPGYSALKDGSCVQNGCTADPYCQDCDDARGVKVCIQCVASSNRYLAVPQYACVCKEGFYDEGGICKPCSSGCATCTSATKCTQCVAAANSTNNGACSCPQSYFFASDPIRYCKRCKPYCLKCTSENSCDLCLPGFSATSNGECVCARGKYVNSQLQCVPCINNCTVCSGEANCTLCAAGFFLQDTKCVTRCNVGYFISGVVCEKCQDGCSHCDRAGSCIVCEAGRYAYNGLCYVNCPSGSIAEVTNMTCLPCNAPCGNCTQHPSKCLTCLSGNFFEFGCVESCPVGTFSENKICKYCSFECAACLGSANTCIACPDGQYLFEGKCFAKCPIPLVNGKCPNLCPSGYFTQVGSGNCIKCSDKCTSCDGAADRCTACASGVASNGACVTSCPAGTVNINGNCKACSEGCSACSGAVDKCTTCQSGYFLASGKCIASCDSNYYRDGNNGCRKCPDTCKTCTSATSCTACVESRNQPINGVCYSCIYPCTTCTDYEVCTGCLDKFSLVGGRCTSQCPAGSSNVNGVCKCSVGVFQNGQCVSSCSSGFTSIDGVCTKCSSSCAECSGNVDTCTACPSGFQLNAVTGKCEINRNCQFGQYFSSEESICKRICPTGYSFQDSVCVSECLSGFRDNGFGGCVELGIVTGCSFPYFYQQGSCVSQCNAGSYPNSANRVCETCSSNCFSCLSSAYCLSCRSGFDLKSNICITGSRCTGNKLKYNGVCVDACPLGTVGVNGYCERRCDPNTYFLDNKCYAQCPSGYKYRTDVACVVECSAGYVLDGSVCKLVSQSCPSGQFFNTQTGACVACQSPCVQCSYTQNYCTACPAGYSLTSNKCTESNSCGAGKFRGASGSCATCPSKCQECVSADECSTCAAGYVFNGADCIVKVANLRELQLTQSALSRRANTVFVSVKLTIIPNGLSSEQKNNLFLVVPSENSKVSKVSQWISATEANTVIIAVEYESFPTSISTLFLALNAQILSESLANVGYSASENSFISVVISNSIAQAPAGLAVPLSATVNKSTKPIELVANKALRLNAQRTLKDLAA